MDEVHSGKDYIYNNSTDRITISKSLFINISGKRFRDTYTVLREIGTGSFGRVYRVKHKITNNTFACKQVPKTHIVASDIFNKEIELLIKMDHPNIIKLYEVYDDKRFIYLIMEECIGGELFDRLIEKKEKKQAFSENEAANIFFHLMSAIYYCHNFKICHRDLKPENLLFLNKNDDSPLKIIDFGLSQIYKDNGKMNSRVGTVKINNNYRYIICLQKF
jgi:calcium-dependent protein kinase